MHLRNKIFEAFEYAEPNLILRRSGVAEFRHRRWRAYRCRAGRCLVGHCKHTLRGEFRSIDPGMATVRLIEAGPKILGAFPTNFLRSGTTTAPVGSGSRQELPCDRINQHGYSLNGAFVPCRTVIWAAGVQASPLGRRLNVPLDRAGRVKVEKNLSVPGHGISSWPATWPASKSTGGPCRAWRPRPTDGRLRRGVAEGAARGTAGTRLDYHDKAASPSSAAWQPSSTSASSDCLDTSPGFSG